MSTDDEVVDVKIGQMQSFEKDRAIVDRDQDALGGFGQSSQRIGSRGQAMIALNPQPVGTARTCPEVGDVVIAEVTVEDEDISTSSAGVSFQNCSGCRPSAPIPARIRPGQSKALIAPPAP